MCGGSGSRLGKIGKEKPKSLLMLNNKPILGHILNILLKNDFTEIHISGYYKISQISEYIRKFKNQNIKCHNDGNISIIQRIKKNLNRVGKNLLVCYGDEIANIDFDKVIKTHNRSSKYVTLTTLKVKSNFGFLYNQKGLLKFVEKPYLGNCNIGFMIFDYKNINKIKASISLPNYINKLCKLNLINEYIHNDKHITINTIEDLLKAKKEIKKI